MIVKLQTGRVGTDIVQGFGSIIEVADDEGARMIEAGQAVRVETQTVSPRENAALRTKPPKPRNQ